LEEAVGVRVDTSLYGSLDAVRQSASRAESVGYDGAFSSEASHDPFLPLALSAEVTERLELLTNIAVGFARSPMDLAQIANDLQLLSRGRFVLGLGSQIRPHIENRYSMPWTRPVRRMGDMVDAIKAIQRCWQEGSRLDFRGEIYRHSLMTPFFSPGANPYGSPPVFVAGLGPKMTAMAAEKADGLLVHPFNTERYVRDTTATAVEEGLDRAKRSRRDFTVAVTAIVATGLDGGELEAAVAGVRRLLAFYASTPSYRVVLEAHGWGELQGELNVLSKQGRWQEMNDLVTEDVLRTVALHGSPDEVAGGLRRRYAGIADRISWSSPYPISEACEAELLSAVRSRVG
jgi:probable F420-dependent oxidoreductase